MESAGGAERAVGRMEYASLEDVKFHSCIPVPCVTLGMSPDLSEPPFPHLRHGNKDTVSIAQNQEPPLGVMSFFFNLY